MFQCFSYALGTLILNGESSDQRVSVHPLERSGVPYNVYGLVRMCTTEKLIYVRDRALLYHKYGFDTIDCVKVLRSREPWKQIGVRFLQVSKSFSLKQIHSLTISHGLNLQKKVNLCRPVEFYIESLQLIKSVTIVFTVILLREL